MKKTFGIILGITSILVLSACTNSKASTTGTKEKNGVTVLKVAHTQNYVPYDYVNDKGESDGFEVAVLKEVDKKLKDYSFEYKPTSDEDLLIGLDSGKYDIGTKGAWVTDERKKKFIIPEKPIGASIIGITYRTDSQYKNFKQFSQESGKLVPISPQNAQYNVVESYNKQTSDSKIKLIPAEQFTVGDAYKWVLEGRYDAYFDIKLSFQNSVTDKKGAYHQYADKLSYLPYKGIPTYPLLHKNATNEKFAKEYDQAIKELQADGTISKLSKQYFGEDVFSYVN